MSDVHQSLAHSKWDCKYHVVFVPKEAAQLIKPPALRGVSDCKVRKWSKSIRMLPARVAGPAAEARANCPRLGLCPVRHKLVPSLRARCVPSNFTSRIRLGPLLS
jgi:hypothetical protein